MKETLEFLYSLRNEGSKFGIERMRMLCERLKNPQLSYPSIHVAGTNGKGSVCTMLSKIYRNHGYKVGLFTSPHLLHLGERVSVNGKSLSFSEIEKWVDRLLPISKKMEHEHQGLHPTFFELITAIGMLEFQKQMVDLAIFETGLGGRLDSTNILEPMVSVITTVGFDHCDILGSELKQIAYEKAGIIKTSKPVVVGWLEAEAKEEILKVAREKKSPVYLMDQEKKVKLPETNLAGLFQRRNAAQAKKTVNLLNASFPVDNEKVLDALKKTEFPGRWQTISIEPTIILDACHNGQGAKASTELWNSLPDHTQVWFAASEKERAIDILPLLLQRFNQVTFFQLDQLRSCTHKDFRSISQGFTGQRKFAQERDISELYEELNSNSVLLVTGSIYLVSSVLKNFQLGKKFKSLRNWQDHW